MPPSPTFRNGSYFIENITDPRLATNITFENFASDLVKGLENKNSKARTIVRSVSGTKTGLRSFRN